MNEIVDISQTLAEALTNRTIIMLSVDVATLRPPNSWGEEVTGLELLELYALLEEELGTLSIRRLILREDVIL